METQDRAAVYTAFQPTELVITEMGTCGFTQPLGVVRDARFGLRRVRRAEGAVRDCRKETGSGGCSEW